MEKKLEKRRKQFDDNENPMRDIWWMQSFICLYSTLFMSIGIYLRFIRPLIKRIGESERAKASEWASKCNEWEEDRAWGAVGWCCAWALRVNWETEPLTKYIFFYTTNNINDVWHKFHIRVFKIFSIISCVAEWVVSALF